MFEHLPKLSALPTLACLLGPWAGRWALRAATTVLLAFPGFVGSACVAAAEDRSLKLFFIHTGERATITFKRDGRFDPKGLSQINRFLRDWRRNEPANLDPRLLDLVWEVYDRSGAKDYIHVVSAYRSPRTNNMLRTRSARTGVAKSSQHMLSKAMDFYIPGVKLTTLRALAMQMQVGGVGYYPTSGSPFVHLDVGRVRAWPRMTRQELVRLFPDGNTLHLPTDGRPLPGYERAVADYRRRIGPSSIQVAETAGDDEDSGATAGSGLLTAMIPTPSTRAQRTLDMQTRPQPAQAAPAAEYVDFAAMAVPVPALRPPPSVPADEIQTASIAAAPIAAAWRDEVRDSSHPVLKQAVTSIAYLPIDPLEEDVEEEADGSESLTAWALSPLGSTTGMSPPLLGTRALSAAALNSAPAGGGVIAPRAPEAAFDDARF